MNGGLNIRSRQLRQVIFEDYIATAEPVGSRTICQQARGEPVSPTEKKVMSDLEEMVVFISVIARTD